jgi:hypothetical protein
MARGKGGRGGGVRQPGNRSPEPGVARRLRRGRPGTRNERQKATARSTRRDPRHGRASLRSLRSVGMTARGGGVSIADCGPVFALRATPRQVSDWGLNPSSFACANFAVAGGPARQRRVNSPSAGKLRLRLPAPSGTTPRQVAVAGGKKKRRPGWDAAILRQVP